MTYKYDKGAYWLLIFHHNIENNVEFFEDEEEALSCNKQDKYSILGYINSTGDTYKIGDKFEFLLESKNYAKYFRWKQTNFPLNEDENQPSSKTVAGFVNISCQDYRFTGLAKVTIPTTYESKTFIPSLLDGQINADFWLFCIASYGRHPMYPNTIPALPDSARKDESLWLRITKIGYLFATKCEPRQKANHVLLLIFAFVSK